MATAANVCLEISADGAQRDDGNAGINFDGAFHRLNVVELHHRLHINVLVLEDLVDRLAGRDVRLEANEFLVGDRLELDRLLFRERMLGMTDQDQRILRSATVSSFASLVGYATSPRSTTLLNTSS